MTLGIEMNNDVIDLNGIGGRITLKHNRSGDLVIVSPDDKYSIGVDGSMIVFVYWGWLLADASDVLKSDLVL